MKRQPRQPENPMPLSEVLEEVVDVDAQMIHRNEAVEQERRLQVAERLADSLRQVRSELIEERKAGEPVSLDDLQAVGEELQERTAEREALRQQQHP